MISISHANSILHNHTREKISSTAQKRLERTDLPSISINNIYRKKEKKHTNTEDITTFSYIL